MRQQQDAIEAANRRRTIVRTMLFLTILGTIPFYLLGFWLWGTAPDPEAEPTITQIVVTNTPIGGNITPSPTVPTSTVPPTSTLPSQLNPTAIQFIPPATVFIPPTATFFIPSATPAPTLTPIIPTNTPIPTQPDLPSPLLTATAQGPSDSSGFPSATPLLPPSDTPAP